MERSASRTREIVRLGLIAAIGLLLALSRTTIATATSDLVLVCHGTGSDSNEIVIIRIDSSGMNGHELEELAKTYDCRPAGGGDTGGSTDGGSGGSTDGGSGGSTDGGSGGSTGGTSGGSGGSGGSTDGGSGGTSGSDGLSSAGARIVGSAGVGSGGATRAGEPQGLVLVAGGVRFVVPATDTIARFLAHSTTGQQLGVALTAFAGIGFLLLVLFGSLARRRA